MQPADRDIRDNGDRFLQKYVRHLAVGWSKDVPMGDVQKLFIVHLRYDARYLQRAGTRIPRREGRGRIRNGSPGSVAL
jgi:hypothetical protein